METPHSEAPPRTLSASDLVDTFVRRWRIWVWTPVVLGLLAVVVSLVLTTRYRTYASFLPETPETQPSGLSSLLGAGGAGGVGGLDLAALTGAATPSAFYVQLLQSRTVREEVVRHRYDVPEIDFSGNLVDFFDLDDVDPRAKAVEKAVRKLRDATGVSYDVSSGLVTISVTTRSRRMSYDIVNRYMASLEDFNQNRRSLRTRARVRFLETQVDSAQIALRAAEDTLEAFLEQNRSYQNSPALVFQENRLQRHVTTRTGIVQQIRQQYEQAQLDLVASIPTVSIVDEPTVPQEKSSPKRTLIVLGVALVGLILGLVAALLAESWESVRERLTPESRDQLDRLFARFAGFARRLRARLPFRRRGRE